jgi:dTDP-4-amino-4,6-dideoxygalactose transaminase
MSSKSQISIPDAGTQVRVVPFVDLRRQYHSIRGEVDNAVANVLEHGVYVGDPYVSTFESEFADYVGVKHCVGVSSGTSALELTLRGFGIGPGDEVILPANTFIATAEAILAAGAIPVFADVNETSYNLDPDDVVHRMSPRTKAIIAVDLYGQPADLDTLAVVASTHGLTLIEDACQAHGATFANRRVGSISQATCFSFYPAKNLGAYGEGGAVTTDNCMLAERIRLLRDHGSRAKYQHEIIGHNHRLHALQAALLSVKLRYLDTWVAARRRIASQYGCALAGSAVITPQEFPARQHAYHLYVVRVPGRDSVQRGLTAAGIATGVHYPVPLHLQPALASLGHVRGHFPHAERCSSTVLSLPMFPELNEAEVEYVAQQLLALVDQNDRSC